MTYLLLNLGFLVLAVAVAGIAALVHRRRGGESQQAGLRAAGQRGVGKRPAGERPAGRPRTVVAAVVLSFLALCVLTAVFDNLMIAVGLFEYSAEHTSGWRIGLAPLEDFAYVLAAAVLLPAVWALLPAGKGARDE